MGGLDKPLQPDDLPGGSCHIALLISFASRVRRWRGVLNSYPYLPGSPGARSFGLKKLTNVRGRFLQKEPSCPLKG